MSVIAILLVLMLIGVIGALLKAPVDGNWRPLHRTGTAMIVALVLGIWLVGI